MPEHDDELRALRERAYGPGADIDGDAAALSRLRELEGRSRPSTPTPETAGVRWQPTTTTEMDAVSPVRTGGARVSSETSTTFESGAIAVEAGSVRADGGAGPAASIPAVDETGEGAASETDPVTGPGGPADDAPTDRPRRWWTGRIALLWIGSIVAALVVGAVTTNSVAGLFAGQVAVLGPDDDAEWPSFYFGEDRGEGVVFDEFHGLIVLAIPQSLSRATEGEADVRCIYILPPGSRGGEGLITAGCTASPFPAVASFAVSDTSPQEVREAYATGTALRFTLDGGQVRVDAQRP